MLKELGRQFGQRSWKANWQGNPIREAVVEFPPHGASYLGGCPNAKYAGCRSGEARRRDLVPRGFSEWSNTKGGPRCRACPPVGVDKQRRNQDQ